MRIKVLVQHTSPVERRLIVRVFEVDSPDVPTALQDIGETLYHGTRPGMQTRYVDAGQREELLYCTHADENGMCHLAPVQARMEPRCRRHASM